MSNKVEDDRETGRLYPESGAFIDISGVNKSVSTHGLKEIVFYNLRVLGAVFFNLVRSAS